MEIPKNHPRYASLQARHLLTKAYEEGVLATAGLIAHGRGEAFDYLIGEWTIPSALAAEKVTTAHLLIAEKPVLSVNGNVATLCPKEIVDLANHLGAKIEVNLFYRTPERMEKVIGLLEKNGGKDILGANADSSIPGLDHQRGKCTAEGIGSADVVLVPLEDGDRCKALVGMGKKVCVVDLNPLSRTSMSATVTIMDEVTRAMKNIIGYTREVSWREAERVIAKYDNKLTISSYLSHINKRLSKLAKETKKR